MNKTVINGTPLQNSIYPIDTYLTAGKLDLLPNAKIIPKGKQNIKQKKDTIKFKDDYDNIIISPCQYIEE